MNGEQAVPVGVIGRGFGARAVAPAFEAAECTVVDVVSPRDDAAVAALCARADIDLISVHSPPFLHRDHVRRAIEAGHAVLCDKPFGANATDAEEMFDLARDAGVLNLVNYEFRAHPIMSKMRSLVLEGVAGKVEHVHLSSFEGSWAKPRGRKYSWSFDASRGGGWVRVNGSHHIDFFRFTYGEVVDASAVLRTTVTERPDAEGTMHECSGEDSFTALLRTEQGVSATIDATATSAADLPARTVVVGDRGVLEVVADSVPWVGGRILLHTKDSISELFRLNPWTATTVHDDNMMMRWTPLIRDAVRRGTPEFPLATFADGLATARVIDKLTGPRVESISSGRHTLRPHALATSRLKNFSKPY